MANQHPLVDTKIIYLYIFVSRVVMVESQWKSAMDKFYL